MVLKNAQKNSWKIQNEVIACIAEVVRRHIRYVLDNSNFFSVIVDEVTDRYANKEVLLLCVRYVNLLQEKPTIWTFLDSGHVQGRSTGAIIGNHILHILLKHQIDLEPCRTQVYDGESAMASQSKGVPAVI